MQLERKEEFPFCGLRRLFMASFSSTHKSSTRRRPYDPYVAAINHLHDVIYRGRGCSSTWKHVGPNLQEGLHWLCRV
jgi:hypothetical protein